MLDSVYGHIGIVVELKKKVLHSATFTKKKILCPKHTKAQEMVD